MERGEQKNPSNVAKTGFFAYKEHRLRMTGV
jgi:hypothetical protein